MIPKKSKWGGGNKDLIKQFETKKEKVENWIPIEKEKMRKCNICGGNIDQKYGIKQKIKRLVEVVREVGEVSIIDT